MSLTDSTMMPLGKKAPAFDLPDTVSGEQKTFVDIAGPNATVVMFICNHCPYVLHLIDEVVKVAEHFQPQGIGFVAISSNDISTRPEDGPEQMQVFAESRGFTFAYLYDESQEIAKAYDAVCTPDFFVFDADGKCAYRGQFDESRPKNGVAVTGAELRASLDAILEGDMIPGDVQVPSQGCSIKWKTA